MSYRNVIAQLYYRVTGRSDIIERVPQYEALFRSGREQIESYSRNRLAAILTHASKTVPFYKEIFRGREIQSTDALKALADTPVLTKEIIRKQRDQLISSLPGERVRENTSGGSTGEPVRLLQDREMGQESRSGELMFMGWTGYNLGDPHVLIWGVPQATFAAEKVSRHEKMFRFALHETYLNCYRMTPELIDDWISRLNVIKPVLIEAYVDALHEVARRMLVTGQTAPSPRGIIVSAGVLTPSAREDISAAFNNAPLFNRYGSREVGNVACSCGIEPELHVHEAWNHLEIVNDRLKPCEIGEEGNILVTLFANRTMPLIRYRIEDRGTWASAGCKCGRNTKRMAAVCGRTSDYLIAPGNVRINGTALTTLLYKVDGIRRFQYRQTAPNRVVLAIVPMEGVAESELTQRLSVPLQRIREIAPGIEPELKFENEILPSNSGKHRYIINEIGR